MALGARLKAISPTAALSSHRREAIAGWILASPWILGFLIFTAGPMLVSVYLALTDWNLFDTPRFVGLHNFRWMFTTDRLVPISLRVTSVYSFVGVPLHLALGFSVALLLNQKVKGLSTWRTIYWLPSVVSGVAVALLWAWIFNPEFGLVNYLLSLVGIDGPGWLIDEDWALPAFIVMSTWGVGGGMLIYLAGLQGVPTELYEAAQLDGAGAWHRFWSVTIPMMTPIIFFNLIMGIISHLQVFTSGYIMTGGGPNNATLFFMILLYNNAFDWFRMGYASALAWLLFTYIMVLTILVLRSSQAWVYYAGELKGR